MAYPVYHIRCYFSTAIHQRISNHQPHSCQNRREHFSWKAYDEPTQTGTGTGVGHFPCPQVCERAVCQRGNMRRLCHPRHRRRQSPRPFLPAQLFHHLVPIATFLHPPHLLLDRKHLALLPILVIRFPDTLESWGYPPCLVKSLLRFLSDKHKNQHGRYSQGKISCRI